MFRLSGPLAMVSAAAPLLLAASLAIAATPAPPTPVQVRITHLDASAFPDVRLSASVLDAAGRPVEDVGAAELLITEDGRPQRAAVERTGQRSPVALVLALDVSGSMSGAPLADAKAAMTSLVRGLGPADRAAIVTFNTSVAVAQPLTGDQRSLLSAIDRASAGGNTAIFDAVGTALEILAPVGPSTRRAIVLLTDGIDNSSHIGLASIGPRVRDQGQPLYAVGLGSDLDRHVLQALADASSGGALYVAPTSAQLAGIYASLGQQIAVQYAMSYRSDASDAPDGATVSVTLQVVRAGAVRGSATVGFTVPPGRGSNAASAAPLLPLVPSTSKIVPNDGGLDPAVPGLLGAATVFCLLLWVASVMSGQALTSLEHERLARYVGATTPGWPRRSLWARAIKPFIERLARPFGRIAPRRLVEGTAAKLAQTGGAFEIGALEFIGLRMGLALLLAILAGIAAFVVKPIGGFVVLVAVIGGLLGYLIPGIVLGRAVRSRRKAILRAMPAALDMLALAAAAGMTLDGALGQVAHRWRGPLSDEFRRLLMEFNMGRDRRLALRALGDRTGVPEVARFANAVIQADVLGAPIARVLADQSVEMRTRRRQRAEESARKAPVKMLFPMVGLIFPALFVVILGPAVPRFLALFQQGF